MPRTSIPPVTANWSPDALQLETIKLGLCICLFLGPAAYWFFARAQEAVDSSASLSDRELDLRLQAAAESALGQREGAIVVIDPQTGLVRAMVNPRLAVQSAFQPGSTIKPFTTLAALGARIVDSNSRIQCRGKYKHKDFAETCAHPQHLAPLNPSEALAYSCNYYFLRVGERLSKGDFDRTLTQFGFGQKTGIDLADETPGAVGRDNWQPQNAIGEGNDLLVTPLQLLTAYAALLNGGHLLTPSSIITKTRVRANLYISEDARALVLAGMRGAVRYGTAEQAGLASLPLFIAGKTGTFTPVGGAHSEGWFVGLCFDPKSTDAAMANLGVVVYLKRAHGADAAEVARPIFEEFGHCHQSRAEIPGVVTTQLRASQSPTYISVHQVTENQTLRVPLEEYVLRVAATEGSVEDQPEALKALAIAIRTYALKNMGRHSEQGYDFCSTTHCQRFGSFTDEAREAVATAVQSTEGLVLRDNRGRLVESYFGASCGGMTANLGTLWGTQAPAYLLGVRDEYCESGAHYSWTDVIDAKSLARALRSDTRTDVGQTIRDLRVARQDESGRAQSILVKGDRTRAISGWEFKLIVGRALGWNVLKSSKFKVFRSGPKFVFHGGGFGHGLGLCQEGSHVMAQRGYSFRAILAKYFPGTNIGLMVRARTRAETMGTLSEPARSRTHADLLWSRPLSRGSLSSATRAGVVPSVRRVLAAEHVRINYPEGTNSADIEALIRSFEANLSMLKRRLASNQVEYNLPTLEIFLNETTGDFVGRTGQPSWAAAATKGNRIELQPLEILRKRRILETTIRHELVHVLIDMLGSKQTPRWLAEGFAMYLAGEGELLQAYRPDAKRLGEELDRSLESARSVTEMKTAYAQAYYSVRRLIISEGETGVWKRITDGRR